MAEQLTGTVIAEKYRLDSLLRKGEIGDFYRGRHLFMDKPVTLKVLPASLALDEQIRSDFSAEARAASSLSDPAILAVNDFGSNKDGSCYVVYEGFEGSPLKSTISAGGQFSVERAASIARQIAAALATAHENGFVHGNLTPDSILLSNTVDSATVKVFDFEPASNDVHRSSENRSPASVAYLAPESFSGLRAIDGRSDIYSLGIILYQMLAGEVPFRGETPTDVMLKHAENEPPALNEYRKDVPSSIEGLIRKALAKDPDERQQNAAEFITDLDRALAEAGAGSGRLWKTAAAMVVGIGVLAAALIYGTSSKQTLPVTQLQPDANGQPVQPLSPATGAEEQNLISMPGSLPGSLTDAEIVSQPPQTLPGGDNYNPWASGGTPPAGAPPPTSVPPGGQVYSVPSDGSVFMPTDPGGVILVPIPSNNEPAVKPTPAPKTPAANSNTQTAPPVNPGAKPSDKQSPAAANSSKPATSVRSAPAPAKRTDAKSRPPIE